MKKSYQKVKVFYFISLFLLVSCAELPITRIQSNNHNDRIRFLVLHHTAINYAKSLKALTEPHGVSAHYMITEKNDSSFPDNKAEIIQLVDENKRAWQAGRSYWQGQHNLNDQSIGIELVYVSNCSKDEEHISQFRKLNSDAVSDQICFYPDFDDEQIKLLIKLVKDILKRNPEITPDRIIGHADIAPDRRVDPGPRFPWQRLYKAGIGSWYDDDTVARYWKMFQQSPPSVALVQNALSAYGYGILETSILDAPTINALTAFQMHFRPWQVNGEITNETAATLFALIEKYRQKKLDNLLQQYDKEKQPLKQVQMLNPSPFDEIFTGATEDTGKLVENRRLFIGHGKSVAQALTVSSDKKAHISLYINGRTVLNNQLINQAEPYKVRVGKFIKQGYNTLKITNIEPEQAQIKVKMAYPTLSKNNVISNSISKVFSKKKLKKVDLLINEEVKKGFPGAELLILKDGKIIKHSRYGYKLRYDENGLPLAHPEKLSKDTLFDLASNSKMYATNFALMKLVSEGKLDINKPVHFYLPEYQKGGRESRTVRDLLTHTAGYAPTVDFFTRKNKLGPAYFSQNKKQTAYLLMQQVPFQIGRHIKMQYSDLDYMLLGLLVERITAMPLDSYVEKEIYQPLGLHHTVYNPLQKGFNKEDCAATELKGNTRNDAIDFENIRRQTIQCEVHDEKAFYSMGGVSGHAGLFSTADDLAVLTSVLLNRGGYGKVKLFNASILDAFTGPSALDISLGLGWRRAANGEYKKRFGPYASPYAYGHTGWTGTLTVIDPFYDLSIILLTNRKHSPVTVQRDEDGNIEKITFAGDKFETAQYGSIVSLIYEAMLEK